MANPNIVSVATILGGNAGWNLSNTLTTTLLEVTAEYILKINRIVCTNVDGSAAANLNLYEKVHVLEVKSYEDDEYVVHDDVKAVGKWPIKEWSSSVELEAYTRQVVAAEKRTQGGWKKK